MKFSSAILAAFAVGSVAGRDYGLFVENQLKAKSSQLFGFEAPISDADVAVSIPRAAGQPAEERQQLAAGLSVSYVTRKVAMHGDMIAFWPNDTEYTHLIVCNEGGRAGTTPGGGGGLNSSIQRIEVATGNVETILHGMSRCDGIRTTQWGTVLATEENGADGGAYEIIDPLSTTGNWLASRGAMGGDADIRKAIDSVVPSSSIVKRTALASQSWEGLEVLSNGVVIGGDELRPNKDKDGGAIFKFVPTNLYDCGAVVRPNQLCPNLISDLSESPLVSGTNYALQAVCSGYDDWGQGCEAGKAFWVKIEDAGNARAEAAAVGATGFCRPEDLHVAKSFGIYVDGGAGTAAEADFQATFGKAAGIHWCWTNTCGSGMGEVMCATEAADDVDAQGEYYRSANGKTYLSTSGTSANSFMLTRFNVGDARMNSHDNLDFQIGTNNVYVIEDHQYGEIWACLPDGSDRDSYTDGCVSMLSINDPDAEPSGFIFDGTGKTAFYHLQHGQQPEELKDYESNKYDGTTDDLMMITGWTKPLNKQLKELGQLVEAEKCSATLMGMKKKLSDKASTMTILHVNDHHSHIAAETFPVQYNGTSYSIPYGGYPNYVALFDELATDDTLKIHAGDAITGTSFYSLFKGQADASMMQHVCFDTFTMGNHEFDDGDASLANFLTELNSGSCSTALLGANIVPGPDSPLNGLLQPYTIKQIDGDLIGIVGIDIRYKTMYSSNPTQGTVLLDEASTAQAIIDKLTNCGIDKIVLVTHIGYDYDIAWMAGLNGVDIIVGGDSHTLLGDASAAMPGGNLLGPFPTMVGDVCIVHAWEYGHGIGKLDVQFDENGKVVSCDGHIVYPFDKTSVNSDVAAYLESYPEFMGVIPDAATQADLDVFASEVTALKQTVIATVPEGLCYSRFPGDGRSKICTPEETLAHGGPVCNIVAKAFLYRVPTADFAIQNGGGCRTDINAGNLTMNDAYTVLPFANTLVTLKLTGAQVVQVLNEAIDSATGTNGFGASTGAYPYASAIRYDVDASASVITNVEVNPRLEGTWTPIDLTKVYTLVTNSFTARGGDHYDELLNTLEYVDTYFEYAQSFVDYALSVGVIEDLPIEEYSTQNYIPK